MAEDAMANLTRDAVDARKMGMSYGQYIAYKENQELKTRQVAVLKHERLCWFNREYWKVASKCIARGIFVPVIRLHNNRPYGTL